ncbi:Uncharacterized protein Fot_08262 [Forsythia ovata]|uniref:Uncharacterized protein n=1 Tax=Forsythia ovata TaxID=205694 RepID=A0ABD1X146_9LAMI
MKKEFLLIRWDKDKIQNYMKNIKKSWSPCHDVFKDGLSRFTYVKLLQHSLSNPKCGTNLLSNKNRLAEVLLHCVNQSSSKDNELLEHLVEIGVKDDDELLNAKTFLLENPTKLQVFNSFLVHRRKNMLMRMFQNAEK